MSAFEEYRKSVEESRAWFLRQHGAVVKSFDLLNSGFNELGRCLQLGITAQNKSHVSLAPLLMICQRQSFLALESLSTQQAYQAWVLIRPGIESVLVMGKWMDDRKNHDIWANRHQNLQEYVKEYSGKSLRSSALPNSGAIQRSLKSINDNFTHPNSDYYFRHVKLKEMDAENYTLSLLYFDDENFHWASVLAMIHLLIVTQDSLARMFSGIFTNLEHKPDQYGLGQFESIHAESARNAAKADAFCARIIHDIGVWPR